MKKNENVKKKSSIASKICTMLFILFVIAVIIVLYRIYKTHYFNDFYKAEYNLNQTEFTRDGNVKYSDEYSYKLESKDYNDAMFYKKINVEKNTSYKVSCMIKTENVISEKETLRFWSSNMLSKYFLFIKKNNRN